MIINVSVDQGSQLLSISRSYMILLLLRIAFLFLPLNTVSSFLIPDSMQQLHKVHIPHGRSISPLHPFMSPASDNNDLAADKKVGADIPINGASPSDLLNRRDLMKQTMALMLLAPFENSRLAAAAEKTASLIANSLIGATADHPIAVIGAGGKTGLLCVAILTQQYGRHVRCVTRSGRTVHIPKLNESNDSYEIMDEASANPLVTFVAGDVTKYSDMVDAVQGTSGVIFAASASAQQGSDPAHVDYLGLYQTARACLAAQLPNSRLVVVSAGSITRPDALGYKATNAMVELRYGPQMMEYKLAGEDAVRKLYEESTSEKRNSDAFASYIIVRPGGLRDGPAVGPENMHISQGDVFTSEVSRLDVAHVTVAALLHPSDTVDFCTFEVNQKQGLTKVIPSLPDLPKLLVHTTTPTSGTSTNQKGFSPSSSSSSYFSLLYGMLNDAEMQNRYLDILNDEIPGSSRILPLQSLMTA